WFERCGYFCHIPARSPVTIGAAREVPLGIPRPPDGLITETPMPIAPTSGFILPSADGPIELIGLLTPFAFVAATASTCSLSAGVVIVFQALLPSFPALETTTSPRSDAHCAARAITVVFPSRALLS